MFQSSKNANRENTSDRNKLQCCYSPFGSGFTEPFLPFEGCSCGSVGKESACNVGDLGSIPGLGRSPGEQKGYPLQYSGLENSMDYSPWGRKQLDTTERLSLSVV
ncbi:hypothetical protein MG293_010896 [Ovis ammon polii]|uniref:Uncharacterized protein n=1 Tax=Ovis ammon polii TaxID=230172 RepID=A0AAD4U7M9_OVIAM|nr:hypothetical protein MG293_010896 [Ovis ammon polii]